MEQFKRALLKNNQRQMLINRRSIQALKAGRHVMAGWRNETREMIAMWHDANRGLAEANAILRAASLGDSAPPVAAEVLSEPEEPGGALSPRQSRKRRRRARREQAVT